MVPVLFFGIVGAAITFLYWLLRRSENPSLTSVERYWKKVVFSKVGNSVPSLNTADLKIGEGSIEHE